MSIQKIPDFNDDFEMAWKCPGYVMPIPSLQYLFHFEGEMGTFRQPQSDTCVEKSTVMFKGGRFAGPKLRGQILSGGGSMRSISTDPAEHFF